MALDEFLEHWAEYLTNPWGEERADLRSGAIAALVYNVHRGKDQAARSAHDFVLYREVESEEDALQHFIRQQKRQP